MGGITISSVHPRGKRFGFLRRGAPGDPAAGVWITEAAGRPFVTPEQAERFRSGVLRELARAQGGPTIAEAVKAYLDLLERRGRKPTTIATCRGFLDALWPEQGEPLASVGPADYEAMVRKRRGEKERYSAATHQQALIRARAVCALAIRRGWLKSNPFAEVEPQGRARRGKLQLSQDEADRWTAEAFRRARGGDETTIAALCCFLLGLRASEPCTPAVRDLDAGGTVLRIVGKRDRVRRVRLVSQVPEAEAVLAPLRELLARAARGKFPLAPLLETNRGKVWRRVRQICKAAGVPEVCPHSLRGLHGTLRVEAGEDVGHVAAGLGNSARVLEDHYLQPGAVESGQIARVVPLRVTAGAPVVTSPRNAR